MKKSNDPKNVSIDEIKSVISDLNEFKTKSDLSKTQLCSFELAISIISSFLSIIALLNKKNSSIKKLKKFIFGSKSEKSSKIEKRSGPNESKPNNNDKDKENDITDNGTSSIDQDNSDTQAPDALDLKKENQNDENEGKKENQNSESDSKEDKKKRKGGGGKNGHDKYTGATEVNCPLKEGERPGDPCPECLDLKLEERPPSIRVKLTGSAPVQAYKFNVENSACLCGASFSGDPPEKYKDIFNEKKYSPSALASIITQKFDMGVPYGALHKLQDLVGVPVPASTQANKIKEHETVFNAIYNELTFNGANADIIGFDDTRIMILKGEELAGGKFKEKNGHGSVYVCKNIANNKVVIIYDLSFKHGGIYLEELLKSRIKNFESLICICDGLPCYTPYAPKGAINSNCNVHGRRNFVYENIAEADFFSIKIIENYKLIYKNEKDCVGQEMTAKQRLKYHQENSLVLMQNTIDLCKFMVKDVNDPLLPDIRKELLIPEHVIPCEPNSDLFSHAKYILRREKALTSFLRTPGVPLDTNNVEQMVKAIIEVRKKGYFFQTENSAVFSGKILSIIETAQANKINSFEYIEFIIQNEKEVIESPKKFLPWNYQTSTIYCATHSSSNHPGFRRSDNCHSLEESAAL